MVMEYTYDEYCDIFLEEDNKKSVITVDVPVNM
jgi:hypothetical protein